MTTQSHSVTVVVPRKSIGLSILLTIFFGPLGLLYTTVFGAILMLIVSIVAGILTFGLALIVTWPICILWGAVSATKSKKAITHI